MVFYLNIAFWIISLISFAEDRTTQFMRPQHEDALPTHVFVPPGFDDNDNVQVVIDGELKNTCFQLGPTHTRVDHIQRAVYLRQEMYRYTDPGCFCMEIRDPYSVTVNLGIFSAGKYKIFIEHNKTLIEHTEVLVAQANSPNADDFVYAPVDSVYIERGAEIFFPGGEKSSLSSLMASIAITGTFKNTCIELSTVEARLRKGHIIEVLPKTTVKSEKICAQAYKYFQHKIPIAVLTQGKPLEKGRYLIHVRSHNRHAVNLVTDF